MVSTRSSSKRQLDDIIDLDSKSGDDQSQGDAQEGDVTRSDIWFEDGNVILVAADNTGYKVSTMLLPLHAIQLTFFKVYKGILSQHSEVFRDMLELPPSADDETVDDCPVIKVSDSPNDMRHLLSALFNSAKR